MDNEAGAGYRAGKKMYRGPVIGKCLEPEPGGRARIRHKVIRPCDIFCGVVFASNID